MGPVRPARIGLEIERSGASEDIRRRLRVRDQALDVDIDGAKSTIKARPLVMAGAQRTAQQVHAELEAPEIATGARIGEGLIAVVDRLPEEAAPGRGREERAVLRGRPWLRG